MNLRPIAVLIGTLTSVTWLQAQAPSLLSATKVGDSEKVLVRFNTAVTPAGVTNLVTDDFPGATIDPSKWKLNPAPWLPGGSVDSAATSVVQTNGQVEFDVFATADWGGISLKSATSFSASLTEPLVFEITREFFDQNANLAFPGVWITDDARSKFVYFGEDFGTDPGGWQYNRQIGDADFDNTDPEEGIWNTPLVNDDSVGGDFFNNGDDHRIKAVVDGTTVRLYLDGFFASEVSFPLASGIFFEFGAYCTAATDEDENEVNTAFSNAKIARLNPVALSNFSISNGGTVTGVAITADPNVLELTTTGLAAGSSYTLTVGGVQGSDGATIAPNATIEIQTAATKNSAHAAAVLADKPVAYFQMDQVNGSTVPNLGSVPTAGTFKALGGPNDRSWLTSGAGLPLLPGFDLDNTAALFDGIKTYIDTGVPYFQSRSAFTIEMWVKPALLNDEDLGLVGSDDASIQLGFSNPGFGDPGTVHLWTQNGGEMEALYPFPYNEWHQIAAVGNGTNLLLYFDGTLGGTGGQPTANYGDDFIPGGGPVYIGLGIFDALDSGHGGWQGAMDEIAIFTNALSADRIQAHYAIAYAAVLHPTVTITNPVANASLAAGSAVTVGVQTSPAAGRTISKVQFFDNGNLIDEDTSSPFSLVIPSVEAGRHALTAKAFDDLGVSSESAPVKFKIGNLPLAVLVVPGLASDLIDSDEEVRTHLRSLGFDVIVIAASALTTNSVSEAALVVASDTDDDNAVELLAKLPVPIVTWDEGQQPNYLFTGDGGERDWNDEDNASVNVVDATHPIAVTAKLTAGPNEFQDPAEWGTDEYWAPWGVPSSGASIIATTANIVADANPVPGSSYPAQIYAFAKGAKLIDDSPAPERRVFLPIDNRWNSDIGFQLLSDKGVAVFDAAVNWAALPYLGVPTIQGGSVRFTWSGGLGDTLQSAETLSGPWTDISNATSPYSVPASGASKFFRLKR